MPKIYQSLRAFMRDERGMETVEWAIMAAIIVAGLVAIVVGLGDNIMSKFTTLKAETQ